LQDKRLQRAKEILKEGQLKASDIYQDMGYNNLLLTQYPLKINSEKSKEIH
jgi:AraC-like DNA-binding protein